MCTLGALLNVHPEYPLVLAANRDEVYARPARPPALVDRDRQVVAGTDVLGGGTWLGVTAAGRVVGVTNHAAAQPRDPTARSRGLAVREALVAADLRGYVAGLDPRAYAGMNLLYGEAGWLEAAYLRPDGTHEIERLGPGVHVLCNDRLGAPGYPRGTRVAAAMAEVATAPWPALRDRLAAALADHTLAPTPPVPAGAVALPDELRRALTATCIHAGAYGTRSATLVAIAADGVAHYAFTDGPPCTAPWQDATAAFRSTPR
ncbi:MAG: NRDE family protein [Kofleriaceae bacterium]